MKCPYCSAADTKVIDSRPADDNSSIRRRRQCESCGKRFTTYEKLETMPLMAVSYTHLAYAGDIIGVFDPGIFSIGDTLCLSNEKFEFEGIPTFAPEHFARVRQMDTMKRKQFIKGISQIAQEGACLLYTSFRSAI